MSESEAKTVTVSFAPEAVPPYVPYRSFRNFTDSLKQGIPSRIDRSVMPSMSGALQGQLTTALRYLKLITTGGHPTPVLPQLVNSEGHERAKVLRSVLLVAYPFLFERERFDLMGATPRMMEEQFAHAGASGGTIDKCINFFLAAAKDAELPLSPHLKMGRGNRTSRARQRPRGADLAVNAEGQVSMGGNESGDLTWAQMLLSKFPSFDPSWPDEVKAKWFDGFHRLMRQGLESKQP
jgi:hypothetical protein